jgi:putative copper export protein
MEPGAIALAVARGLHDCGVLSAFGVALAGLVGIARRGDSGRRLLWGSVAVAWLAAPVWLVLQAGEMSGATTAHAMMAAMPAALFDTGFGHALLLRLALLIAAIGLTAWRGGIAVAGTVLATGLACVVQYLMGHAAAPDGPWQAQAAALHMLAAGAWIGGLLPLAAGLGCDPARTARRFSLIGLVAVLVLAGTAFVQGTILIGGLPGLLGSAYGRTILLKTGLFAVLLGFAAVHRFLLSLPCRPARMNSRSGRCPGNPIGRRWTIRISR